MKDPYIILQSHYNELRANFDPLESEALATQETYRYLLTQLLLSDENLEEVKSSFFSLTHDKSAGSFLELNFRIFAKKDPLHYQEEGQKK